MTSPVLIEISDGEIRVFCPYNAAWIEEFKQAIPKVARNWDSEEGSWTVADPDRDFELDVVNICQAHFRDVEIVES